MPFLLHADLEREGPPIVNGQAQGSLYVKILEFDGMIRTYMVHVPSSYGGSSKVPLVVGLHGAGEDGYTFLLASGWASLSEEKGFIMACPTGSIAYGPGFRWNIYNWTDSPDDVGFLMTMINQLKTDYLIDSSRVYMTGYSNGASMADTFAFKYANVLVGLAPVSGRWMTAWDISPYDISQPNAPIPVYIWRGELENSMSGLQTRDVQDQLQKHYWIDWNNNDNTPRRVTEGDFKTEIFSGGDAEVRFTEIIGRSHNTYGSDTAAKIWNDFFKRFSRDSDGRVLVITSSDSMLETYLVIVFIILLITSISVALAIRKRQRPKQDMGSQEKAIANDASVVHQ